MGSIEENEQKNSGLVPIVKGLLVLALLAFIVVCGISFLIALVGPGVTAFFSSLSTLDSAIVVALITAMVSVVTFVSGGLANSVMKRNEYLRAHREEPYMRLISMFYDFQSQTNTGKEISDKELASLYNDFTKELTLWGSSKEIKTWGNWRVASSRGLSNPNDLMFGMEKVLIQLRRDMGLKRGLAAGDLLRLTVNDIDDYIASNKKEVR